jgi:carbohydrate kinase (thermoresistant glucokinase family)
MGVSGSGKTTVGALLAQKLSFRFYDGDDYHSKKNIKKMASGQALTDADRREWLLRLNGLACSNQNDGAVIVCSALKESYRQLLSQEIEEKCRFVFLSGTFEEIMDRMQKRVGHFMPPTLLRSQFATLESPKGAIVVSIKNTPEAIVSTILDELGKN